jgi:hypothetical protein
MAAPGGPAPLDQFHFQDLTPLPGGGARVNISSQSFTIPTCGVGGASGSTVSTYEPINLCVKQGDYVDFNDEGGYVPNIYRSGAPYEVLGAVPGAALDSFIRSNGTGNGSVLSASDTTAMDGFGASTGEELMLQVLLGTGSDARYVCAGGSKDAPAVLAPMRVSPQTDGVNHQRLVSVAIYCRPAAGCTGNAQLTLAGGRSVGSSAFSLPGAKTSHLAIRVSPALMPLIRKRHSGVATTLLVTMEGRTYSATVNVRIL